MLTPEDFQLEHIDRHDKWKGVFQTIDDNFDKIRLYMSQVGARIKVNTFTALEGEEEFFLDSEYNTRNNSLMVYYNGVRQFLGTGFIETSTKSFSLVEPAHDGDVIVAVYLDFFLPDDTRNFDQKFIDELLEARVGIDGTEYPSLSEAIRNQILRYNIDFATNEEINEAYELYIKPYLGGGLTAQVEAGELSEEEYAKPIYNKNFSDFVGEGFSIEWDDLSDTITISGQIKNNSDMTLKDDPELKALATGWYLPIKLTSDDGAVLRSVGIDSVVRYSTFGQTDDGPGTIIQVVPVKQDKTIGSYSIYPNMGKATAEEDGRDIKLNLEGVTLEGAV